MSEKLPVLVIIGPTASGKTGLSIDLAAQFNGEIISGDSLQIYRELNIGTAKVTATEAQGIPHYLIDEREMTESYSVAEFQQTARERIAEIHQRQKLPIIVGGTGLYIQALLFDFRLGQGPLDPLASQAKRAELQVFSETAGAEALWQRLREQDPGAAAAIHPNNQQRVMRALEVVELTGQKFSEQPTVDFRDLSQALYDVKLIGLQTERERLYQRINQRVDVMMTAGLVAEAEMVYQQGPIQAAQGIGYKEFFPYFKGESDLATAVEQVKQNSRRYAKRQLTWFNNRMTVTWFDLTTQPSQLPLLITEISNWLTD